METIDSKIMDAICAVAGLKRSPAQLPGSRVLGALMRRDGISQQRVADELGIRLQSLVQTLKALEAGGSITRERSAEDRREMLVYITEKGRERMARHVSRSQRCALILAPLGCGEKEELLRLITKVAQHNRSEIEGGAKEC